MTYDYTLQTITKQIQGKRYLGTSEENGKHIHRSVPDGCEAVETKYY